MEKDKDKILRLILGFESDDYRKSTLQLALKQARCLGGIIPGEPRSYTKFMLRRSKEGQNKKEMINTFFDASSDEEMDVLTSLSLYLIVLDQLGHIFGNKSNRSNRVKDAIELKGLSLIDCRGRAMTESDLNAISQLRNSINHNFGLASFNPKIQSGFFKYTICFDDDGDNKPVANSLERWNGDWCDKSEESSIHVYPFSLMNYVEDIYKSYVISYQWNRIQSPLSLEELKTRFTLKVNGVEISKSNNKDTRVSKDNLNTSWVDEHGVVFSSDKKRLIKAPEIIREYTIPNGTEVICNWAFGECRELVTINICDSVVAIEQNAFFECESLTTITIPGSVPEINRMAFNGCDNLKEVIILPGVKIIDTEAFGGCASLESITLPKSLIQIKEWAFSGCVSLRTITIPSGVSLIERSAFEGCHCEIISESTHYIGGYNLYSVQEKKLVYCSTSIAKYVMPEDVSIIGDHAFFDCTMLKSIDIPDSVQEIEDGAFCGCEALVNIRMSKSLVRIGDYAFSGCNSLKSISLPDSISEIGKDSFEGCDSLKTIYIPVGSKERFKGLLPSKIDIIVEKPNCQQNSHNECTYEEEEEGLSLKSRRFGRRNAKKEVKADSSTEGTADAISDAYEGDTDARWNTD